ncbi:hypothetical protein WHX55_13510 [Pseudomonas fluorescens]|nr:hypothetical protein [Pseudomonas fluorescens]
MTSRCVAQDSSEPSTTFSALRASSSCTSVVCFQNYPDSLLPDALKNGHPLRIQRLVDVQSSREAL